MWVREGECNRCGDCCIGNPFPDLTDRDDGMCPLLSLTRTDGTRVCTVHETDNWYWAAACRHWPSKPEQIAHLPRCSFRFRWAGDA
jgi:hypothetical protein